MFTGLVEDIGRVERRENESKGVALWVKPQAIDTGELAIGESVAHDGACLTVTEITGGQYKVFAGQETLDMTTLGQWDVGAMVNLERSLQAGARLGGHFVTGHVDCVATVVSSKDIESNLILTIELTAERMTEVVGKGSITVNGVSLTVNSCTDATFSIALIPHTREVTTLGKLKVGSPVNIETDILAKYVGKISATKPA